jgi:carbon-monoxide dehydrogenase small subunit
MEGFKLDLVLSVNGKIEKVSIQPNVTLLHLLREELMLTGAKEGCGMGQCGACTVILDGRAVNACLVLAADAQGKEIWTIEGIARQNKFHPIHEAFIEHSAIQCGFCTPGMVMMSVNLLKENPHPKIAEIKETIKGNFCRCTGYKKILDAIQAAAKKGDIHEDTQV